MKKIILILTVLFMGCSPITEKSGNKSNNIDSIADNLLINQKIGQFLCLGFEDKEYNKNVENLIKTYTPGSIILFARNVDNKDQLTSLIKDIRELYDSLKLPKPFIFVDEEGGRVSRLKKLEGEINSASWYFNNSNSKEYATNIVNRLKKYNINSPLSPVLDICEPSENVIGDRSFTNDTDKAISFIKNILKVYKENKILSVGKHFPGHGSTEVDSHYDLPVINMDFNNFKNKHIKPYIELKDDLDAVLVAHLMYPSIDDQFPTSISKKWITDILLNDIKFNGLVLSDDLTMEALNKYGNLSDRVVKFLEDGGDIALVCHPTDQLENIQKALNNFYNTSKEQMDKSLKKIINKKYDILYK